LDDFGAPNYTKNIEKHMVKHVSKTINVGLDFPTRKVAGRLALPTTPWKPTKVLRQTPQVLRKTPGAGAGASNIPP
jgi:hypothetical protein